MRARSDKIRASEKAWKKANAPRLVAERRERHQRFRAFTDEFKVERGCVDCGYNASPVALDFDHLPGSGKRRDVSLMATCSWAAILAEIEKCEVVCSNCHRIRTQERRQEE